MFNYYILDEGRKKGKKMHSKNVFETLFGKKKNTIPHRIRT